MKTYSLLTCFVVSALTPQLAQGHGTPIIINNVNFAVVVSNGSGDVAGYASQFFADGNEDAQLSHFDLPDYGPIAFTDLPGIVLQSGIDQHSVINMEIIPRPMRGGNPLELRSLWHWNAASQAVAIAPNGTSLTIVSGDADEEIDKITIPQIGLPPRQVFVTHLEPENIGQHVHYLGYLLDDSPAAATGAYGFFARFLIAPYQNPDPILIVLNNGLDAATLQTAALAINAAAAELPVLAGDYNVNGVVDAADYVVWRESPGSFGQAPGYNVWRNNFRRTAAGLGSSLITVPEPGSAALLLTVLFTATGAFARRKAIHCPRRS
jgi:hypothetical protein